jgi:hypothetical protein
MSIVETFVTEDEREDACIHEYQYGINKSTIQWCASQSGSMTKHCIVCGTRRAFHHNYSDSGDDQHDVGIDCWATG